MFGLRKLMIKRKPNKLQVTYDREYDILYVSVGDPVPSYSDEEGLKGLYIRRSMDSDKVTGVTIMDYSKRNKISLTKYSPLKIDFSSLNY
ncbi:DUF2283 domain-containing protein [Desulforamulus reducens]|uniref:DUF2283 domain-containing protein n=1 Tax=Desulforamulus reducens TaxID=59610 RepID=UPI000308D54F|nr:DUF2283 domain-containing protein [Desulforamulus reducens]